MFAVSSRRAAAVGGVVVLGAIALAVPASAEPLEGSYTATVTNSLGNYFGERSSTWVFTPCGPDCVEVSAQGAVLHARDGGWSGTFELRAQDNGEVVVCTRGITEATLTASDVCPQPVGLMVNYQLVKNG
ncbi:hypothetical protein ACQI4F_19715 [Mycolicibacterium vaccae]|uniref:hypothetical protein n=1 Tax=Mycolicibacterium vaccae TaxID=1810 RepID=UPI003CEC3409